jgi:hypothetical protein
MTRDKGPQPPSEPELDEYGVPVQKRPAKGRTYVTAYFVCTIIPVVTCITEVKYDHRHLLVANGLPRMLAIISALIGILPLTRFGTFARKQATIPGILALSFLVGILAALLLLTVGILPHGLPWDPHGSGGGY